jgi:SRSO17 transposase
MSPDPAGVLVWREEPSGPGSVLSDLFVRAKPRRQADLYVEGLLSAAKRKNGWQLAELIDDARPWRTQRVLSHALWDQDGACDLRCDYTLGHLGTPDRVLVVDETGFLKKGANSAGVARHYSGTAGRVENVQVGVFLGYANSKGHALIDRELYLPKEWYDDAALRNEAAVPEAVTFATKPALARRMIGRALDAGLSCACVLGDEIYGLGRRLRMDLERREQPSMLAIRRKKKLWAILNGHLGQHAASHLAACMPAQAWRHLSSSAGPKGERLYDWARLQLTRLQQPPWGSLAAGPAQSQGPAGSGLLRRLRPRPDQAGHPCPGRRPALEHRGVLRGGQAGGRLG